MKNKTKNSDIIKHISKYCDQSSEVIELCKNDFEIFRKSNVYINAVAMCVLQMGELAKRLSHEFRENNKEIPWALICRNRDKFAHDYGTVDPKELWQTAKEDVPALQKFCKRTIEFENLIEQEAEPFLEDNWDGQR